MTLITKNNFLELCLADVLKLMLVLLYIDVVVVVYIWLFGYTGQD